MYTLSFRTRDIMEPLACFILKTVVAAPGDAQPAAAMDSQGRIILTRW